MTQNHRNLSLALYVVVGFLGISGTGLAGKNILDGLDEQDTRIEALQSEVNANETRLLILAKARSRLDRWNAISLPPDPNAANSCYRHYLQELCHKKLSIRNITDGRQQRNATSRVGTPLSTLHFQLRLDGTLANLVRFLEEFHSINVPHHIQEITITTQGSGADTRLDIGMRIEVLALPTATRRDFLPASPSPSVLGLEMTAALGQGPVGLPLGLWSLTPTGLYGSHKLAASVVPRRKYASLSSKDIFVGLVPPPPPVIVTTAKPAEPPPDRDILKVVQLTSITSSDTKTEASLRNFRTNWYVSLRVEKGADTFEVRDFSDRIVLNGKVRAINPRNLVFGVGDKKYVVFIGQTLDQALQKEMNDEELGALGERTREGPE